MTFFYIGRNDRDSWIIMQSFYRGLDPRTTCRFWTEFFFIFLGLEAPSPTATKSQMIQLEEFNIFSESFNPEQCTVYKYEFFHFWRVQMTSTDAWKYKSIHLLEQSLDRKSFLMFDPETTDRFRKRSFFICVGLNYLHIRPLSPYCCSSCNVDWMQNFSWMFDRGTKLFCFIIGGQEVPHGRRQSLQ